MKKFNVIYCYLKRSIVFILCAFLFCSSAAFYYMQQHLPDVKHLKKAPLQVPLRIYSQDNQLIAIYGNFRRTPVALSAVPQNLVNAILATEDHRFYNHSGIDIVGLIRAAVQLMRDRSFSQGGSTITMQVARNFYLTPKKTLTRKFKEILLAIKIDSELSKQRILELYLNKIYLGHRAYGVAAAATVYYGKPLDQLSLAQMAMLAGLPKAPSALNPLSNPTGALKRRNHVLRRMHKYHFITAEQLQEALQAPLDAQYHGQRIAIKAPYVAEMARRALIAWVGKDAAYNGGYQVYTTIDSHLQEIANEALNKGLLSYEERHDYNGPIKNLGTTHAPIQDWLKVLKTIPSVQQLQPAVVVSVSFNKLGALLPDGQIVQLGEDGFSWALPQKIHRGFNVQRSTIANILQEGDVIYLRQTGNQHWQLTQRPKVEGALISLAPHNGAVKALVGGFDFDNSKFNRALQAKRQSGSAFKPFVYAAALANGFTLASTINDAPVVVNDPNSSDLWRPQNDNRRFYGPTRLRIGLVKSRNLVSIRLLKAMGIEPAVNYCTNFGFAQTALPQSLSLALGTALTSPLQIARGYAVFANGGHLISPYFIKEIRNAHNQIVFQAKPPTVPPQNLKNHVADTTAGNTPSSHTLTSSNLTDTTLPEAPQTISPQIAYLITNTLQDVIKFGTGRRARVMKRNDIAGKTGSTNQQKDAWFVGYNTHLVTATWVGYDQPQSLHEYGAQAALPIWIDFMGKALQQQADLPWTQPSTLVSVRIDPRSGWATTAQQSNSIFEIFRRDHVPSIQDTQDSALSKSPSHKSDDELYKNLF